MSSSIDVVFTKRMRELRSSASKAYKAVLGEEQRSWEVPDGTELSSLERLHLAGFDRSALNTEYSTIMADPDTKKTAGDIAGIRLQLAMLAAEERAFRHRHMSLPRAIATSHGRRYGQAEGSLFTPDGIEADVANLFQAGSVGAT